MNGFGKPNLGKGLKVSLPAVPGVKNPMKVGTSLTVKTPKSKSLPDATDKPSVFFKNEELSSVKHVNLQKLRDFIQRSRSKR